MSRSRTSSCTHATAAIRRALVIVALAIAANVCAPAKAHAACTVSTTPLGFGTYDVFASTPDDSTGNVTYRCDNTNFDISITLGQGGSASYSPRRMSGPGSDTLAYNIYLDANRTTIWGDGSGGSTTYTRRNPQNNRDIIVPFYGRIPTGQDVAVGTYTDTVVVTINF